MEIFDVTKNIEVRDTESHGKSLFARRDFKKDEIVFVAFGKIVDYYTDYTIPIDHNLRIEPRTPKGSPAMYLCHSCDPNVGVKNRTLFVAMRNIKKGEEVCTHYGFLGYEFGLEKTENGDEKIDLDMSCCCGAANCAGKFRAYKDFTKEERAKWREYISDYLLDETRYP